MWSPSIDHKDLCGLLNEHKSVKSEFLHDLPIILLYFLVTYHVHTLLHMVSIVDWQTLLCQAFTMHINNIQGNLQYITLVLSYYVENVNKRFPRSSLCLPTLLNIQSRTRAVEQHSLLKVAQLTGRDGQNVWGSSLKRVVSLNVIHISWADQSWLIATAYHQTTWGKEDRPAVCQTCKCKLFTVQTVLSTAEPTLAYATCWRSAIVCLCVTRKETLSTKYFP